jgi:hypothetical protein
MFKYQRVICNAYSISNMDQNRINQYVVEHLNAVQMWNIPVVGFKEDSRWFIPAKQGLSHSES